MTRRRSTWIVGGALAAATAVTAATGIGTAHAVPGTPTAPVRTATEPAEGSTEPPENEVPITGDALAQASAAALAAVGAGTVTDTEVGDEEGYYEIEVTHADGRQVDVHLDKRFTVLDSVADEDGER